MNKKTILKCVALFAFMLLSASCATTKNNVMLADVISFSDDVKTSFTKKSPPYVIYSQDVPFDRLNTPKPLLKEITNVNPGGNTSVTYALDIGLDRIKYVRKHQLKNDKIAKYYIILFTDGLDNTSVQVARNNKQGNYKDLEAYQKKVQKKIKKLMGNGKETNLFQIYPMLLIGQDLTDFKNTNFESLSYPEFAEKCKSLMENYRGASKGWAVPDAIVQNDFDQLYVDFEDKFTSAGFEFYVPKGYAGKTIRMYLTDGKDSTFFDARVVRKGKKYFIDNLSLSPGLTFEHKEKKIEKVKLKAYNNSAKDEIFAWFRIEGLKMNGRSYIVIPDSSKQYFWGSFGGIMCWQPNSEYEKNAKPQVDTYFQLIFDTSGSLSDVVKDEKEMLIKLIKLITSTLPKENI